MRRLIKPLCALVAVINLFSIVLFAYGGVVAASQDNFVLSAKCATLLAGVLFVEVICIVELTENE